MTTVIEHYNNFLNGGDPYLRQFFILRSMAPMVIIVSSYVLFVKYFGPKLMKNRKPIELRKVIIVYNFALVAYYAFFILKGIYFVYRLGLTMFCYSTLDSRKNPLIADLYMHGFVMYLVRYIELVDTVFLVLSKKFKMITALHVFHHAVVPVFGWFGLRSERNTYLAFFMGMNSFVHIIMYTYYSVAALGPEYQKYLWWKKYLTLLQISQFFIITVYLLVMYAAGCVQSKVTVLFTAFLCVLFFFWFIDYYRHTVEYDKTKQVHQNGSVDHYEEMSSSDKDK